jgi:hypothetical protein
LPQTPQLALSRVRSKQVSPQELCPVGQLKVGLASGGGGSASTTPPSGTDAAGIWAIHWRRHSVSAAVSGVASIGMRTPHSGLAMVTLVTISELSGCPGTTSRSGRHARALTFTRRFSRSGETRSRPAIGSLAPWQPWSAQWAANICCTDAVTGEQVAPGSTPSGGGMSLRHPPSEEARSARQREAMGESKRDEYGTMLGSLERREPMIANRCCEWMRVDADIGGGACALRRDALTAPLLSAARRTADGGV